MFGLSTVGIIVIAIILLILFGGKKLPEFSRGISDAIREFKKAANDKDSK